MQSTKLLFAYDGSTCADAALHDLQSAGLPSDTECVVLTVADVWLPPEDSEADDRVIGSLDPRVQARVLAMRRSAKSKLAEATAIAQRGAHLVKSIFPSWKVSGEAVADSPGWGILNKADSWPAEIVVLGAHGMSIVDRIAIGSVSRRVLSHASCSVRIARGNTAKQLIYPRLIIGFDGSPDADIAVEEVTRRVWPEHTQVRLVTVVDDTIRTAIAARILKLDQWVGAGHTEDHNVWLLRMSESAAEQLRRVRLETTSLITEGEPKRVLLETAQEWGAHCIFLGATGLRGLRRLLIGSLSSGLANSAACTVEVVRQRLNRRKSATKEQ
jgi:nucleotide-binding universal stress UspA family protein